MTKSRFDPIIETARAIKARRTLFATDHLELTTQTLSRAKELDLSHQKLEREFEAYRDEASEKITKLEKALAALQKDGS